MLWFRAIKNGWLRGNLAWRAGFFAGIIACVLVLMAAYGGVPQWWEAGDGGSLPMDASFADRTGELLMYNTGGPIRTADHAFFEALGSNGRACVTCHQPASAMSVSTEKLQERWDETRGTDPVFAAIDGSNCPNLPQQQKSSHSLLLKRGLFRIYLPWPGVDEKGVPIHPEFDIEVVRDPTGCNTDPAFGLHGAHPTISVFRRPRMVANLKYVLGSEDAFSTASPAPHSSSLMADGRVTTLAAQAASAAQAHEQCKKDLTRQQLQEILDFESQIYMAQSLDDRAGDLIEIDGPRALGAWNLGHRAIPSTAKANEAPVFLAAGDWKASLSSSRQSAQDAFRASVIRGNEIFSSRIFAIQGIANLEDHRLNGHGSSRTLHGTCATCHQTPLVGTNLAHPWMDVGTTVQPFETDSANLPLFKITCNPGTKHPFLGRVIYTTDPGRALTTGKCSDVGSIVMQQFRGLSARAPYFSNGSAQDLSEVVNYYDRRFNIGFSLREKQDLINFLGVL